LDNLEDVRILAQHEERLVVIRRTSFLQIEDYGVLVRLHHTLDNEDQQDNGPGFPTPGFLFNKILVNRSLFSPPATFCSRSIR